MIGAAAGLGPEISGSRPALIALAVLLLGHLMLWSGRSTGVVPDAEPRLRAATGAVLADTMEEFRFAEHELLPSDYVAWRAQSESALLISVYAALFLRDGVAISRAHDPELCYGTEQWNLVARTVWSPTTAGDVVTDVAVLHFERQGRERAVIVWQMPRGHIQAARRVWWRDHLEQLWHGRSDYIWVRAEAPWQEGWADAERGDEIRALLVRIMESIQTHNR